MGTTECVASLHHPAWGLCSTWKQLESQWGDRCPLACCPHSAPRITLTRYSPHKLRVHHRGAQVRGVQGPRQVRHAGQLLKPGHVDRGCITSHSACHSPHAPSQGRLTTPLHRRDGPHCTALHCTALHCTALDPHRTVTAMETAPGSLSHCCSPTVSSTLTPTATSTRTRSSTSSQTGTWTASQWQWWTPSTTLTSPP